jgi:hypothetical protein
MTSKVLSSKWTTPTYVAQSSIDSLVRTTVFVGVAVFLSGCGDLTSGKEMSGDVEIMQQTDEYQTPVSSDERLEQQLPLEITLTAAERSEYYQILSGIHNEVHVNSTSEVAEVDSAADPNQSCDRCGRETGFIPVPDLFLTRFIPVDMKALTLGLVSWIVDVLLAQEALEELLEDEAPEQLDFSYRLTLVRVDIDAMSEEIRTLARSGMLLSSDTPEEVSITSLSTSTEETAITFEHGFSYVFSIVAIETNTKLTSAPSAPLMIYCPHPSDESSEERLDGGCVQLISNNEMTQ